MRCGLIPGWSLAGRENGRKYSLSDGRDAVDVAVAEVVFPAGRGNGGKYSLLAAPCIVANASNTSSLDFRKSMPKHILFPLVHWPEATTGLYWTRQRPSRRLERPLMLHHSGEAPRGCGREGLSVERKEEVVYASVPLCNCSIGNIISQFFPQTTLPCSMEYFLKFLGTM